MPARVLLPCLHGYFFRACTGTFSVPARVLLPCLHGYFFRACTGTSSLPARVLFPCLHGYSFRACTGTSAGNVPDTGISGGASVAGVVQYCPPPRIGIVNESTCRSSPFGTGSLVERAALGNIIDPIRQRIICCPSRCQARERFQACASVEHLVIA